ncbi:sugar dehydrogenase complex small subunit [Gluconobacter wancherniae]
MTFELDRRRFLGATLSAAIMALQSPGKAFAATDADAFMAVSRAAIGPQQHLNPTIARRLQETMAEHLQGFGAALTRLEPLARQNADTDALGKAAEEAGLHDTLRAIIAAWYTGSISNTMNAPMVAYYEALMYRPVADALPVPTYCFGVPGWWTATPPALGISPIPTAAPPKTSQAPAQGAAPLPAHPLPNTPTGKL